MPSVTVSESSPRLHDCHINKFKEKFRLVSAFTHQQINRQLKLHTTKRQKQTDKDNQRQTETDKWIDRQTDRQTDRHCLRHLQIHHKREPRDRYTDNNNRPDIAVFDAGSGTNVELDVALAHPWAKDTLFQASKREAAAAANRENRKLTKYSQVTLPGASSLTLVPLVFEHFGHWGERATRYLQELSTRSTDDDGNKNANEFMCYWRKRFSTALQRCNARTIAGKLSHLLSMSSSNVKNYHTQFCVH